MSDPPVRVEVEATSVSGQAARRRRVVDVPPGAYLCLLVREGRSIPEAVRSIGEHPRVMEVRIGEKERFAPWLQSILNTRTPVIDVASTGAISLHRPDGTSVEGGAAVEAAKLILAVQLDPDTPPGDDVPCLRVDHRGSVRGMNDAAARLLGIGKESWGGAILREVVPKEVQAPLERALVRAAEGLPDRIEVASIVGRGAPRQVAMLVLPGPPPLIDVYLVDQTEREQDRSLARRSKHDIQTLMDGLSDAVAVVDARYRLRRANRASVELARESSLAAIEGRACYEAYFGRRAPCDGCPAASTFVSGTAAAGDVRPFPPDAPEGGRIYEVRIVPRAASIPGSVAVIETIRDVTQEREVARRLAAAERLAALSRLAAGVAHEIKNPLATLAYATINLRADIEFEAGISDLARAAYLARLQYAGEAIERLKEIVNRFLGLGRSRELRRQPTDLNELVRGCIGDLPRHAGGGDVEPPLDLDLDDSLGLVDADAQALATAIVNVLTNAIEATSGGGIVRVRTCRGGQGWVVVSIEDEGPGVADDIRGQVFEAFFSTKPQGSGIGLASALQTVRAHGGSMRYEPGAVGARFVIELPVTDGGDERG